MGNDLSSIVEYHCFCVGKTEWRGHLAAEIVFAFFAAGFLIHLGTWLFVDPTVAFWNKQDVKALVEEARK